MSSTNNRLHSNSIFRIIFLCKNIKSETKFSINIRKILNLKLQPIATVFTIASNILNLKIEIKLNSGQNINLNFKTLFYFLMQVFKTKSKMKVSFEIKH